MTGATDQRVRTVVGTWQERAGNVFNLTIHQGVVADTGAPYTCECDGEIDRKAHERAVLRLAEAEWTAPTGRPATDISFRWKLLGDS